MEILFGDLSFYYKKTLGKSFLSQRKSHKENEKTKQNAKQCVPF